MGLAQLGRMSWPKMPFACRHGHRSMEEGSMHITRRVSPRPRLRHSARKSRDEVWRAQFYRREEVALLRKVRYQPADSVRQGAHARNLRQPCALATALRPFSRLHVR